MTGLDLESFLQLLRADFGAWASLGLVVLVLGLMTWTSWGSRRALRKCLVLSIAAHLGLVLYGSTFPIVQAVIRDDSSSAIELPPVHVQLADGTKAESSDATGPDGRPSRSVAVWDRAGDAAKIVENAIKPRPINATPKPSEARPSPMKAIAPEAVVLDVNPPSPTSPTAPEAPAAAVAATVAPGDPSDVAVSATPRPAATGPVEVIGTSGRVKPDRVVATTPDPIAMPGRSATPADLAAPTLELPTTPIPTTSKPSTQPATVAMADPGEVAAPKVSARPVATVPDVVVLPSASGTRTRSRPDGALPANRDVARSTTPLAPTSTTLVPPSLDMPIAVASARPTAGEVAPPSIASAEAAPTEQPAMRRPMAVADPKETLPEGNVRRQSRPGRDPTLVAMNDRRPEPAMPATLPRVAPSGMPSLPAIAGATGLTRPPADVPAVYRSRLDPNRFAIAQRSGATRESEQAVERALDWLRRHQDPDGRWDGGTAKYKDGTVADGDDDYTAHCPPGDVCFGECYYWEADTALTGLALLAYLGAGYTHLDGQHAETVASGLEFLKMSQKPDGDLRGRSQAVGMYCHTMATLALCEAYALTGDPKLRAPVEKAVAFLVKSRARDGLAWRYAPGASQGDTSILGWVVMVLKSAQEVGIPIQSNTKTGIVAWLKKVSTGPAGGLAKYQPGEKVTPTMTAEAWVCRQFLEVGGPGASSNEAADYLLRSAPGRDEYNVYYWYYGTLAMYQHGGEGWTQWNAQVRDQIIRRQRPKGHAVGSWDPDESPYGTHGGRIYCTALATLSLEVYYRYLRLYDAPATTPLPSAVATDPRLRRTSDPLPTPTPR